MATRLTKLCPRILALSTAVFIFLSVPALTETTVEATRCYWCGPLAEQVHRSQRAPSCGIFDLEQQQTICDKGYTHCAIVATSPPYAVSRLCVKFYQDECYSMYCNSTKSWRMVCACQGDLCNGQYGERETKAFAILPRAHGKTNARNKRSLIASFVRIKSPAENNTIIIINNNHNETTDILQNDQPMEEQTTFSNATTKNIMPKNIEDNIIIEHGTITNIENSIQDTLNKSEYSTDKLQSDTQKTAATNDQHPENPGNQMTTNHNTDVIEMENRQAKMNKLTTHFPETTVEQILKETHNDDTESTTINPTSIEVEVALVNSQTPGKLPPAEALQQNVVPTKSMEITTTGTVTGTVLMSTENSRNTMENIETTTLSTMKDTKKEKDHQMKKSIGAHNTAHPFIILISFLSQYYI